MLTGASAEGVRRLNGGQKTFAIIFEPHAERDLNTFEPPTTRAILQEIQHRLTAEPLRELNTHIKRLTGFVLPVYRLRVGDHRVYYRIREQQVVILAVLPKKDSDHLLRRQDRRKRSTHRQKASGSF